MSIVIVLSILSNDETKLPVASKISIDLGPRDAGPVIDNSTGRYTKVFAKSSKGLC